MVDVILGPAPAGTGHPGPGMRNCALEAGDRHRPGAADPARTAAAALARGPGRRPARGLPRGGRRPARAGASCGRSPRPPTRPTSPAGVAEPLGHRVARHLLGERPFMPELALPWTAASLLEQDHVAEQRLPDTLDHPAGDGRRLGTTQREGARAPAPRRGRPSTTRSSRRCATATPRRWQTVDLEQAQRAVVPGRSRLPRAGRGRARTHGPRPGDLRRRAVRRGLVGGPLGPDAEHNRRRNTWWTRSRSPWTAAPAEAYVARPEAGRPEGPYPGVLFFIDAIGLRPRIAEMAQQIADWGYVVLAPNVLWRSGTAEETSPDGDLHGAGRAREVLRGRDEAGEGADRRPGRGRHPGLPGRHCATSTTSTAARSAPPATAWAPGSPYAPPASTTTSRRSAGSTAAAWSPRPTTARTSRWRTPTRSSTSATPTTTARCRPRRSRRWAGPSRTPAWPRPTTIYAGAAHGYTMADTSMYDEAATERHFRELEDLLRPALC